MSTVRNTFETIDSFSGKYARLGIAHPFKFTLYNRTYANIAEGYFDIRCRALEIPTSKFEGQHRRDETHDIGNLRCLLQEREGYDDWKLLNTLLEIKFTAKFAASLEQRLQSLQNAQVLVSTGTSLLQEKPDNTGYARYEGQSLMTVRYLLTECLTEQSTPFRLLAV